MIGDFGQVIRLALRDDYKVIEQHVGIGVLGDEYIGRNDVAWMEFGEYARVPELVGHGHRVHEAGDGFMIQGYFARCGVGGDNFAAQFVDLRSQAGGGFASGLGS